MLGVGTDNVEKVIRSVFNLAEMTCDRLPKATFARYMFLEARCLTQLQVAEELLVMWESESRTLYSDGTSNFGYHYSTCDIGKEDGNGACSWAWGCCSRIF